MRKMVIHWRRTKTLKFVELPKNPRVVRCRSTREQKIFMVELQSKVTHMVDFGADANFFSSN